jgi:hypothetical protein
MDSDLIDPLRKHWSNKLFDVYSLLCVLVLGLSVGQLVFGAISIWSFLGFWLATAVSFLAGAGTKGSLLVGTKSQAIAGTVLGVTLIAGSLWIVRALMVVIVFTSLKIPNEVWIVVSAIIGFLGATKWDYFKRNVS